MRTNFNVHNSTQNNSNPSFGTINYEAAENTLREVLSSKELAKFREILMEQKKNTFVNLNLFGNGKKLSANIFDGQMLESEKNQCKAYSQHFWESSMGFIKRMVKKIEKRTPEVKELVAKQNFDFEL